MRLAKTLIRKTAWVAAALVGGAILAAAAFVAAPLPPGLLERSDLVSVTVTDRSGLTLREVRSAADGRSISLPADEPLPPQVVNAFVAAEDKRFFHHPGVDPIAVGRAAQLNVRKRRVASGASTITMQLARYLKPHERDLFGKLGEMAWALRLGAHLSHDEVMREYLNRIALGNSIYGVEAAAQTYFNRPASRLSTGQAALIAGMASSPARYDPYRHLDWSSQRRDWVLERLGTLGYLSAEEVDEARETPLDLTDPSFEFRAPHFTTDLVARFDELGLTDAAQIETTIDPELQADVEEIIRAELASLVDKRVGQAAAVVIDNASGEVLAYVGSADFFDEETFGQNDGVRSLRQPGSALKPFAYGLALGEGYTPASVLSDLQVHLDTPSGDYTPRNYDRRLHGPVRLRAALQNSYNVPAVRLTSELHPGRVLQTMRAAGLESLEEDPSHYGVGVVLGNGDVTLWEMARAYRGLANEGIVEPLVTVRRAVDAQGQPIEPVTSFQSRRFLKRDVVNLLTDILTDNAARTPAFGANNALRLPFPVAAKTGTSRAYVDNWTAGFTKERTVAVWVGNFDGKAMRGVSGITGAGPIFRRVMIRAMQGITPQPMVDEQRFEHADICPLSGARATEACPAHMDEVFLPGTAPQHTCPMHRLTAVDARSGRPTRCDDPHAVQRRVLDIGPEYYAWARGEGLEAGPLQYEACGSSAHAQPRRIGFLTPGNGDEYLIEPGIPTEDQMIPVRALAPPGVDRLVLRVSGAEQEITSPFATRIPATRGRHTLELIDPNTQQILASTSYRVH